MTPILAIRPQPGCSATMEAGRELGLQIACSPMFEIRPRPWDVPDPGAVDALLIGSANAIRYGGQALDALLGKPVHAVGSVTAELAGLRGFAVASTGRGGLQDIVNALGEAPLHLLRLAGAEHVPLNLPANISVDTRIVYENVALPMPDRLAELLGGKAVVLLHSAAAARHFADECERRGIARSRIALAALGPRIAAAAGTGWAACKSAAHPRDDALLALAHEMSYR